MAGGPQSACLAVNEQFMELAWMTGVAVTASLGSQARAGVPTARLEAVVALDHELLVTLPIHSLLGARELGIRRDVSALRLPGC